MTLRLALLRSGRLLLWLLIAWVVLRGVVDIVVPPVPVTASASGSVPADDESALAGMFAMRFAQEYLTWGSGKEADRAFRLQGMLTPHLDTQAGLTTAFQAGSQVVESVWPVAVKRLAEERWLVTVAARVRAEGEHMNRSGHLYLAVPVMKAAESGFRVHDYPAFVPPPLPPTVDPPRLAGEEVTANKEEIRSLLTGFFRAFFSGSEPDIAYFLEPGGRMWGMEGALLFQEIRALTVYEQGSETWASVLVSVKEPTSQAVITQRYAIQVAKRDSRWYVRSMLQKGD